MVQKAVLCFYRLKSCVYDYTIFMQIAVMLRDFTILYTFSYIICKTATLLSRLPSCPIPSLQSKQTKKPTSVTNI